MSSRPNIVIVTTHDSGKHFGCYGAGGVNTPNIDAFAAGGVRFDGMFSPSSMCTPSRGSLLTGQWPERNGLLGLSGPNWRYELADRSVHLSSVLRDNGYRTALYGFQHEAIDNGDLGFDTVFPLGPVYPPGAGSAVHHSSWRGASPLEASCPAITHSWPLDSDSAP